jgi:hypothetical protein
LNEAALMAGRTGIRVGSGTIDSGNQIVPLSALCAALFDGPEPLLDRRALRHLHSLREQRYWMLEELAALLEQAALDGPLMLCHDDMQSVGGRRLSRRGANAPASPDRAADRVGVRVPARYGAG